jgi:taurine dioxygenase
MQFEIIPTESALGAEIFGVDLGRELSDGDIERIRSAWLEH